MKIKIPQFWSLFNMTACILFIGWCAYGPEKEVYKSRDGSGANGEKPVQGETNGATGSCQVDRNDPCLTGTSRGIQQSSKTEKRIHMELVSLHDEVSPLWFFICNRHYSNFLANLQPLLNFEEEGLTLLIPELSLLFCGSLDLACV